MPRLENWLDARLLRLPQLTVQCMVIELGELNSAQGVQRLLRT
jgi:hypothetical protein